MTYWTEVDPPMSFIPEGWTYEQKRAFRFDAIDYLPLAVDFPAFRSKEVLCVGDGSGIDAIEFARNGAKVSVVDMSAKAIALVHKHAGEAGVIVNARVADACDLPFAPETFDAVYSFGVYHHIPYVDKAVAEVARVLKPGGQFLGMVYHKDSVYYAYSILARAMRENLSPAAAMQAYSERNPGCPYSRAYSKDELVAVLRPFWQVDAKPYYNVIDLPHKRKVRISIDDLVAADELGWHLFFRATK